ncbi:MAG: hypothetical protein A2741_01545 [Candidatus Zambryskibacteria bacterium RIFCSPHIGHO2_01_FULL_43_27]|uniref:GIY-YIG domain-containing protein n=1 Tax=Candidatus Zambryskibacteria bacterium RIFCSPLOWO2_01_FULL_43_17 TaxID=1802760 RepID=A0A1G2U4B5_9BACT|nr:MAG: hypothetical protein A2741_01545 [Candidatus Zambryskibacteria bacterium RIFCSPHIGHO2_01_FULL_43_27]OHA99504.1 MAG: hypothetical protein A3E93_02770 [Candidatus Zambryskibacteria bacterium RIFCSPHIGHO2_12_FULL_43_12b]OHB04319.1 MAG: hypothetical protein A2920_03360 [Candidatus Zambryskibacteria bacterium RIFCSPLOWO2_01_FULL_43_17]
MHFVYILKSEKDRNLYIGCTGDLHNRLRLHQSGKVLSTKSRLPVRLIYSEEYIDKYSAYKMEGFYKTAVGKRALKKKIKNWGIV